MIDIDLAKLVLIGVVALIVIGPEKFPTVARMAGSLVSRAQRYINEIKYEVSRDIELEEFRKIHQDIEKIGSSIEKNITQELSSPEKIPHKNLANTSQSNNSVMKGLETKTEIFRKKKIAHNSMIPRWYRRQNSRKSLILSDAARFTKHYKKHN
jgi:sec-independent protein translocase protein TatB